MVDAVPTFVTTMSKSTASPTLGFGGSKVRLEMVGSGQDPPPPPCTITCTDVQDVFPHVPSARTQYVVVAEGLTGMELPVPTKVPPQLPVYQRHCAPVPNEPPFLVSVVDCPAVMGFGFALADDGATEFVFTVTFTLPQLVDQQFPLLLYALM